MMGLIAGGGTALLGVWATEHMYMATHSDVVAVAGLPVTIIASVLVGGYFSALSARVEYDQEKQEREKKYALWKQWEEDNPLPPEYLATWLKDGVRIQPDGCSHSSVWPLWMLEAIQKGGVDLDQVDGCPACSEAVVNYVETQFK